LRLTRSAAALARSVGGRSRKAAGGADAAHDAELDGRMRIMRHRTQPGRASDPSSADRGDHRRARIPERHGTSSPQDGKAPRAPERRRAQRQLQSQLSEAAGDRSRELLSDLRAVTVLDSALLAILSTPTISFAARNAPWPA